MEERDQVRKLRAGSHASDDRSTRNRVVRIAFIYTLQGTKYITATTEGLCRHSTQRNHGPCVRAAVRQRR